MPRDERQMGQLSLPVATHWSRHWVQNACAHGVVDATSDVSLSKQSGQVIGMGGEEVVFSRQSGRICAGGGRFLTSHRGYVDGQAATGRGDGRKGKSRF